MFAQVRKWFTATLHHVGQGSLVVGEVRVGGDGGGVTWPQEDVSTGVTSPGDLVLVQH